MQPFGCLLVVDPTTRRISQASANAAEYVGRTPTDLIDTPLEALIGAEAMPSLAARLSASAVGEAVVCPWPNGPTLLDATAHRHDGLWIIELAPADPALAAPDVIAKAIHEVTGLTQVGATASLPDVTAGIASHVRAFTGYDRVMVYRFDATGAGEVIAESRRDDLEPFLGLHYPASDIPQQARALYLKKRVRLLGDVESAAVPLAPRRNPTTGRETDLGFATLRAFSPVHLQYLHNMGVRATLVMSVIRDGALWGLIACHHYAPRWLPAATLAACDVLAGILSAHLGLREHLEASQGVARTQTMRLALQREALELDDWPSALLARGRDLLDLVGATGFAIALPDGIRGVGSVPGDAVVRRIVHWAGLKGTPDDSIVATDRLTLEGPVAAEAMASAAGVLVMRLPEADAHLLWFRPEWVRTVQWAGAPTKVEVVADGVERLMPRQSFAAWAAEVRGAARPWSDADLAAARELRGSLVDVVLRALRWRQLALSQDLLRIRRAAEASSEPIAITDTSGRWLFVNPAFLTVCAVMPDDGVPPFGLFDMPLEAPGPLAALRERPERSLRQETWLRVGSARVPVELRIDPIIGDDRRRIGHVLLLNDLTERYRAADSRRAFEERMQQAQRLESLGVLAGGIAHDFNNLLTSILGSAALAHDVVSGEALQELDRIETAARRAAELCRQLLAYAGKGRFVLGSVAVGGLVHEMRELLDTVVSKHTALSVTITPDLPPVHGDATQLRQVVMNLITNASDALGADGGEVAVTLDLVARDAIDRSSLQDASTLGDADGFVRLTVRDTGCGMEPATITRIFDPFFTTKFTGRGLGLASVLGIVRSHRGAIGVHSVLGEGSTFTVLLPVADPSAAGAAPALRSAPPALAGTRILVVDDEPAVLDVTSRLLTRRGCTVTVAGTGGEAIGLVRQHPGAYDLVVLDLVMPDMDGDEVWATMRELDPSLKVLIASGYTAEVAAERFGGEGTTHFIQKPYTNLDLDHAVGAALGR